MITFEYESGVFLPGDERVSSKSPLVFGHTYISVANSTEQHF